MKNSFYNSPTDLGYQGKSHNPTGCFAPAVLLICLIAVIVFGCKPITKPFIIINKGGARNAESEYIYQDKNGKTIHFYEKATKYSIGDTIK